MTLIKKIFKKLDYHQTLVIVLSLMLICIYYFPLLSAPNDHMLMIGGDGFIIYYNFIDYICNGTDLYLRGINYPEGEFIFLTDGHASFAILFNLIQRLGINVCDYGVGIVHYSILFFLQIATVVLYRLLVLLKTNKWLAVYCSLLIVFVSPQMLRLNAGHFGLSFPFIIPFCLLILTKEYKGDLSKLWCLLCLATMVFFGLNNAYVGALGCGVLLIGGALIFLFGNQTREKRSFTSMIIGGLSLIAIFLVIKSGNHIHDRLEIQWGYFSYNTVIEGFLIPEHSYLRTWLSTWFDLPKIPFHSNLYLGVVPVLMLAGGLVYGLKRLYLIVSKKSISSDERYYVYLLTLCLMFFLISVHFYTPSGWDEFIEDHFSILMMFKCISRFSWVCYFILSIFAVLVLNRMMNYFYHSNKVIFALASVFFLVFWSVDVHRYIAKNVSQLDFYPNAFAGHEKSAVKNNVDKFHLNSDEYSAIYVVPPMQNWNDKIVQDGDFFSDFYAYLHAHYSQIPLINSQLSRAGLSNCLKSLQFAAHPLIKKENIARLDNSKKVLIIESLKAKRSFGESQLIAQSTLIDTFKRYNLRALDVSKLHFPIYDTVCSEYYGVNKKEIKTDFWYYNEGFEDEGRPNGFLGSKAGTIFKGRDTILSLSIPNPIPNEAHEFSVWLYFDHLKYGTPMFELVTLNKENRVVSQHSVGSRNVMQNYQNWVRVSLDFIIPADVDQLKIISKCNQNYLMDELTIKPVKENFVKELVPPYLGYNNYPFDLRLCNE